MTTLTDLALEYRRKGWHPIPLCRPRAANQCWQHGACLHPGKRPLHENWPSLHHASEEEIRTWERRFGAFNVGLLMGHGTFAVDVDPRNGGDVTFEALGVPVSLRAVTPSSGWHVYLAGSPAKAKLGPGVDLIGLGGQIVAPPSVHVRTLETGEPYTWEDCEEEVPEPPVVTWEPPVVRPALASQPAPALPASDARRIGAALFKIPSEDRDTWLKVAMALKTARGESGWAMFDAWSQTTTAGNYNRHENRRQWDSIKAGDATDATVNEESLFWLAQGYEVEEPVEVPEYTSLPRLPFPTHCIDEMPHLMRLAYDWILARSIRPQPVLAFAGTLALFSVLTARRYGLQRVRTNLYVLGIAPTGAGKNDPRMAIKDLLMHVGLSSLLGGEDLASDSGILTALDRSPATLFQLDEFGEMLGRWTGPNAKPHERAIKTVLLSLFSANGSTVLGKEYSQAGVAKNERVKRLDIQDPCMVVHGTSTPDLWENLEGRDAARGFLSRFLVFEAPPFRPAMNAVGETTVPGDLLLGARALQGGAGDLQEALGTSECRMVPALPEYGAALRELDSELNRDGARFAFSGPWEVMNRLVELAQRLAVIRAAVGDPVNPVLRAEDLAWGAAIVRHSVSQVAYRLDTAVASSRTGRDANRILAYIERAGMVTQNELTRAFQGVPTRDRKERIADLLEAGRIVKVTRKTGGRPATMYQVACAAIGDE